VLRATFPEKEDKVVVVADAPYAAHVEGLVGEARKMGEGDVVATGLVRDPGALIPNRTLLVGEGGVTAEVLSRYHVFHLGEPPTALLLTLAARVRSIRVYVPDDAAAEAQEEKLAAQKAAAQTISLAQTEPESQRQPELPEDPAPLRATAHLLKRRYAVVSALSAATTFGVLINTLSTRDHQAIASRVRAELTAAGRKSYTFAVGRANPAKLANFAEVEAWIVIGCWESSLIDGKEFMAPLATPFELRVALMPVGRRVWSGEWVADFAGVLAAAARGDDDDGDGDHDEDEDGEVPPEYDLRTGRYVSRTAPRRTVAAPEDAPSAAEGEGEPSSREVALRARGDVARVGGVASAGAEFLRTRRTWQGLGSDFAGAGGAEGAEMEVGRTGVARGYVDGEEREARR
jgi:diphthamide biosynthesis protein 2